MPLAIYVALAWLTSVVLGTFPSSRFFPRWWRLRSPMAWAPCGCWGVGCRVKRSRRWFGRGLGHAADWRCRTLVAAALHLMTFWNLDLAARQQLAALRAEAGALALWVAPARLPDRDNAAIVYQQACEATGLDDAAPGGSTWEKKWQEAWREKWAMGQNSEKIGFDLHDPELRRFLKRQSAALVLLRQAAAKPGCSFDRDYARPSIEMQLPDNITNTRRDIAARTRCDLPHPTKTIAGQSKTSMPCFARPGTSAAIRSCFVSLLPYTSAAWPSTRCATLWRPDKCRRRTWPRFTSRTACRTAPRFGGHFAWSRHSLWPRSNRLGTGGYR